MPPPPEHRADPRIRVQVPVELYIEGNPSPFRTATADLSLHGCYVETIYPFPIGTSLELKLQLTDTLLILGTVVTCDPQVGNGIHFTKMLPEDVAELQAFIEAKRKEAAEEKLGNNPAGKD